LHLSSDILFEPKGDLNGLVHPIAQGSVGPVTLEQRVSIPEVSIDERTFLQL